MTPPPPGGPLPDTKPPVVTVGIARQLTVGKTLKVPFTTDESTSVLATLQGRPQDGEGEQGLRRGRQAHAHAQALQGAAAPVRHRRSATLTLAVTDDAGNGTTVKKTLKLKAR